MREEYPIDLHMHTTTSDGTDTPEQIVARVREEEIRLFSVTDHDAISACEEICAVLKPDDPRFIPGAEFSCRDKLGKYHILGYGYDSTTEPIRAVVEKGHSLRMWKLQQRLDFIKEEFGFEFSREDLDELLARKNPGKPHIGNLMVKYGYVDTKETAIRDYINKKKIRGAYIGPEVAIRGILESGGIPVLAHPAYGSGDQLILGDELKERVKRLMEFGLQGLEGFYSGFTPRIRAQVCELAAENDLYLTAGSDYHGSNKLVKLGDTGFMRGEEVPEGMQRFLDHFGAKLR